MGLLSTLAKIGGIAAAPFSGGASLALTALGGVGDVLGKQQQGQAQGQVTQAQVQQNQDRNALDRYQTMQGAQNQAAQTDLQRKGFESSNRGTSAKQALLAALLGGDYQGANVSVPGIKNASVSGGLLDSLKNSAGARTAMQNLGQQASTAQTTPLQFHGGEMLAAPNLTALPEAGKSNSFLNTLARIAQIGGAAASGFGKGGD
jgi:hypothetical protein